MLIAEPQQAINTIPDLPHYQVYVSNIKLGRLRKNWPADKVVVFKVHKIPGTKYMLPEAHFYGASTYGTLWYKNQPLTVADATHNRIFYNVKLQLCSVRGNPLPSVSSTHDYLGSKQFVFSVNYRTFHAALVNNTCRVGLDPDRVDVCNLPDPHQRVYTLLPPNMRGDRSDFKIMVLEKKRQLPVNNHVIKYALVALVWQPSYIQTALSRDVGVFTKSEYIDTPERALPGVGSTLYKARSQSVVKINEDFWYNDTAIRVIKIEENKFYFKKILTS